MKPEVRMVVAVALSAAIFYAWQTWIAPVAPPPSAPTAITQSTPAVSDNLLKPQGGAEGGAPRALPVGGATQAPNDPQANVPIETVTLSSPVAKITLTTDGGVPTEWLLPQYQVGEGKATTTFNAVSAATMPLRLLVPGLEALVPERPRFLLATHDAQHVEMIWRSPTVVVRKSFTLPPDQYALEVKVSVENLSANPLLGRIGLAWQATRSVPPPRAWWAFVLPPEDYWMPVVLHDGSVERHASADALQQGIRYDGPIPWGASASRYFAAAIIPQEQTAQTQWFASERATTPGQFFQEVQIATAPTAIPAGNTIAQQFTIYVGPQKHDLLQAVGSQLDRLVDYGWFGWVALPILWLLNFFHGLVHNYGVAIILLTVFVKLLLHPINKSSMQSMKKMQQLQPRLAELRERLKGDPAKLNAEMMQLFKANKVNPAGGCLPMLLQMPVYFALYKVLWNSVELYRAPFFGFYRDLSAPDPYFITPVLLGAAFWLQQKFTPSPSVDPNQKKMMQMMSLVFTGFMLFLPSGLVFYILINTATSIFQQWLMNRGLRMRDVLRGNFVPKAA